MRKIFLLTALSFWLAFSCQAITLDNLPEYQDAGMRYYVRGTQKLQEQDYISAMEELKKAVRARPDMAEAFHNLGFTFEKTGQLKEAINAYERAVLLKANYSSALNNLGYLLATTEANIPKAVQLCSRAVELEPSSANYHDSLGWACYKAGRTDEAELHFKSAIKLDPAFAKAHFNLGLCQFNRKNFQDAAQSFTMVVQINPNFIKAYIPLASCYEEMKQDNKAAFVYQQALSRAPENSQVKKHLQKKVKLMNSSRKSYYFSNAKKIQASSRLSDFVKRKSKNGNMSSVMTQKSIDPMDSSGSFTPVSLSQPLQSEVFSDVSDRRVARISESRVPMSQDIGDGEISFTQERGLEKRYALCNSYLEKGLVQEAVNDLEKIVSLGKNSGVARQAKNLLLKARKMLDERSNERAETHLAMGKDFIRSGKYDMAESEIMKAIDIKPEFAEAHKDLALLHYNQGKLKDAYEESKRAIALDKTLKEAYVVLASLYSKKGRKDDAMRTLRRIREIGGERNAVDELADKMMISLSSES
ncbi:MAG: tetratricopeptide repeat protein [Candidatus Riflebacteria bacterium]|nr:tetratricopeptide repeat protein [Candidatus Riflebacteria bacterium]